MARRRKRFRGLEATLKNMQHATTGALDLSTLPAGSVIKNYVDFITKARQVSYTRTAASKPGPAVKKQLIPFAVDAATGDAVIVRVSGRANAAIGTTTGVNDNDLNLAALTTGVKMGGFAPAVATIFVPSAQNDVKEESQITGRRYNPKEGASYTLPFGQGAAGSVPENTFQGVATTIVNAAGAGKTVSFQPEKFPA